MLTHPSDDACVLLTPSDLDRNAVPPALCRHETALRAVVGWAHDYLAKPHESLGRKGNVCPYVQASIDHNRFYLTACRGRPRDSAEVARALLPYRDWFLELAPRSQRNSQLTTILILFPDLTADDVGRIVDGTQQSLKSEYIEHGLMIGEFHNGPPDKGGLRNPDFRPLRSPVPLLAIRHMVPTDLPFLQEDGEHVLAYLRQFAGQVPAQIRESLAHPLVTRAVRAHRHGPAGQGVRW